MIRIFSGLSALALLAAALPAQAQDIAVNLFISPAGQPFTAPVKEPYPIVLWFKGADKNADGKLDKAENRADAEAFFAVLDRNKDGFIGSQEVMIYEHYFVPEILSGDAPPQILGGDEDENGIKQRQRLDTNQGAVQFSLFREPEPVRAADRNLDYKVSLQEYRDQADRHFDALDANGDGFLTLDELPQTPAERSAKARRK